MTIERLTGALKGLARPAGLVLGVGTFLALLGPYGSDAYDWPYIWFYWVGFIGLGAIFGFGTSYLMPRLIPSAPEWSVYASAAIVLSIPVAAAALFLSGALFSGRVTLLDIAATYGSVLVISGFATAVAFTMEKLSAKPADGPAPARPSTALLDKLPVRLRSAELLSMSAEDHYLRVRTDHGEALILMRLSDAAAACDGVDGARTHRSWWVARAAVVEARKADGRATLVLSDGVEAPVSRTYYPALREAGWF